MKKKILLFTLLVMIFVVIAAILAIEYFFPAFSDSGLQDHVKNPVASAIFLRSLIVLPIIIAIYFAILKEKLYLKIEQKVHELEKSNNAAEAAKKEADKANKLKSEFLANMAHELRTPMHTIINFSRQMNEKIDRWDREKQLDTIDRINSSSQRLLALINDILDISKLEAGKVEYTILVYNINDIIEDVISELDILYNEKSQIVTTPDMSKSVEVECDRGAIHQVIYNLLSNAIKFTDEGKHIDISYLQNGDKDNVTLRMSDEGRGIPEGELESIFDKFIQSKKDKTGSGGTGLGLSICKSIIADHHGQIWAENNDSGGASFFITLPEVMSGRAKIITDLVLRHWEDIRKGRLFPSKSDLNLSVLEHIWDNCFIIKVDDVMPNDGYEYEYLGSKVIESYGNDDSDIAKDSKLISPQAEHLKTMHKTVIETKGPVTEKGTFLNHNNKIVQYRQCFAPLGDTDDKVEYIIGGIRFFTLDK